ncbi:hypothetical protein [Lysinibacillus sp. BPa_S21]|uniref:hypothetical protein n=1 Tax=Lysinibacillus sp. BPa_S21 TaxID=2932478 RepID=UPI002010E993|nr:hypothetical protein [Lysinibacillus sp. BPa_S21]MCL1696863.1 hypothetical protein [Lysinibacillus sp. BPa_S21]
MRVDAELHGQLKQLKTISEMAEEWVDVEIFNPVLLEREQLGYSMDLEGNSLINDDKGSWQADWLVIGHRKLTGDPIIIETAEPGQPVAVLMHGMGDWHAGRYLASSVLHFQIAIQQFIELIAQKNDNQSTWKITCMELEQVMARIVSADEYADKDLWESLLDPAFQAAQGMEAHLIKQVSEMSKCGMMIKEIAGKLNLPLKEAYGYLKKVKSLQG